jgi:UDP-glucose 4-epimerase
MSQEQSCRFSALISETEQEPQMRQITLHVTNVSDEVFNVASGVETSLNDLAHALMRAMDVDMPLEYGPERKTNPVPRRLADTSAAREKLGFVAQVGIEDGLRDLVAWWKSQKSGVTA